MTEVINRLGLRATGGNWRNITAQIKKQNIDTSHFVGQSWAKDKTAKNCEAIRKVQKQNKIPDHKVFVKNSTYNPSRLRERLINIGWDYSCSNSRCKISEWMGKPITLHVDHINGEHTDHRLENLRFLCPNCHQQTETWGNKGSVSQLEEEAALEVVCCQFESDRS